MRGKSYVALLEWYLAPKQVTEGSTARSIGFLKAVSEWSADALRCDGVSGSSGSAVGPP